MRRRMSDAILPPEIEPPKKRIASNGNKLPDPIREGEILTDVLGKRWRLGRSIGVGGFGEIYLASHEIGRAVGTDVEHVVKVEPHKNGPLFVEMNFYIRAAKPEMILEWQRRKRLQHLGMSPYVGAGSHMYKGDRYRFLVLERFGLDLNKLFLKYKRKFHLKTVLYLGIQILDVLEYIHSQGYIHADIKGSNLLIGHRHGTTNNVYLLDFGLACRYMGRDGRHKEYHSDLRKAHNGTIEYTSRDAHIGAHSRRGDLEILGYNLLQWLCSKLPWEDEQADPDYVHEQKKAFMSNIPLLMKCCFPNGDAPAVISQYLKYVASLEFDTRPDYSYCRKLLRKGITDAGYVDDGKLEFGLSVSPRMKQIKKKKCSFEEPENIGFKPKKPFRNIYRQPCVAHNFNRMTRNSTAAPVLRSHQFFWEKILSSHPEKKPQIARKNMNNVTKLEVPKVRHPEPFDQQVSIKTEDPGIPTPAMLEVMARMQERTSSQVTGVLRKNRSDSRCSSPSEESVYPFALTPAMEQVLRRREELQQQEIERMRASSDSDESTECMRVTRSRAASSSYKSNEKKKKKRKAVYSLSLVDGNCNGEKKLFDISQKRSRLPIRPRVLRNGSLLM
ncbi:serine/threonine-protein kinase VRK1-like [Schistocerca piceifrons]|uniref:serine/threonine-protein kinase VRK1-like n=1 Tax=Schistocerca piceifrons TaxID=274613 RepID=UPI001F5FBACB|nr:serine/threonine-protein kinase VRK1-like [Schistocerca piceifrons]XP_047116542.1 serine/threonine-protein kinase VRK1-like [Schistocerca piceifrons]